MKDNLEEIGVKLETLESFRETIRRFFSEAEVIPVRGPSFEVRDGKYTKTLTTRAFGIQGKAPYNHTIRPVSGYWMEDDSERSRSLLIELWYSHFAEQFKSARQIFVNQLPKATIIPYYTISPEIYEKVEMETSEKHVLIDQPIFSFKDVHPVYIGTCYASLHVIS